MFLIENYGFFILLIVVIFILFYSHNKKGMCLSKSIKEGFGSQYIEDFQNNQPFNIADNNYLDSCQRMKDYLLLQKTKKRFELPFNWNNEGYASFGPTPLVPLQSMPTLNFHAPYGPDKDMCC
jgi:hypothetical protein